MHCELVVPGLFAAAAQARLPALELLLARGRSSSDGSQHLEAWLGQAFGIEGPLPAGALCVPEPGDGIWVRADPVHLRLMRDRLLLVPSAGLSISAEEARALCEALNRHFPSLGIDPVEPGRWCARLGEGLTVSPDNPLDLAGREIGMVMPQDANALVNEAQMLMHAHPVNEAREARGEPAVNSLWLWGAGRAPRLPAPRWHSVSADDPLVRGLARAGGVRQRALPAGAQAWLERASKEDRQDGRHLLVLDALRAELALARTSECGALIESFERDWFAPLLGALRAGRIGMVTVHVPDGAESASFETIRGDLRRFWRRRRPLERYA